MKSIPTKTNPIEVSWASDIRRPILLLLTSIAMNSDNPHKDKDRYENEEIDLAFSIRLREDLKLLGRWNTA